MNLNKDLIFNKGKQTFHYWRSDSSDPTYTYYEYVLNLLTLILRVNKATQEIQYWEGQQDKDVAFAARASKTYVYDVNYQIIANYFSGQLELSNTKHLKVKNFSTSHILDLTDDGAFINMTNTLGAAIAIPTNAIAPFPIGTKIQICQSGVGSVAFYPQLSVTMQSLESLDTIYERYGVVDLIKIGINTWELCGTLKDPDTFQLQIATPANNTSFHLPLVSTGTFNMTVDYGDGTAPVSVTAYNDVNADHNYVTAGTYIISIIGSCDQWYFPAYQASAPMVQAVLNITDLGFTELSFGNCVNLTNVTWKLANLTHLIEATSVFQGCTSLSSIPAGLFDNCVNIESFNGIFAGCTALHSIPNDLFKYNVNVTEMGFLFAGSGIDTIPTDLFRYNTKITDFWAIFMGCQNLPTIPADIFKYNTLATNFDYAFAFSNLAAIPTDLLRYNTAATSFYGTFMNCNITSVTTNLFQYNIAATSMKQVLAQCAGLTSIPAHLFDTNTLVTDFTGALGWLNITSIPTDLFKYNTAVTNFSWVFAYNLALNSALAGNMFQYNTLVTNFSYAFWACPSLTGSDWSTLISNATGNVPTVVGSDCFDHDYSLTGYETIPSGWMTPSTSAAPTSLSAVAVSITEIDLAWVAPLDNGGRVISGYKIERESPVGDGFSVLVANTGNTNVTYHDTSVTLSHQYNYKVSAINAIGTSDASNEANANTYVAVTQSMIVANRDFGWLLWNVRDDGNAQGFKVAVSNIITKFTLRLWRTSGATGTLTGYVYSDNAGKPGSVLATFSGLAVSSIPTDDINRGVDYDFTGTFTPTVGVQYWIAIIWTGGSAGNQINIAANDSNPYSDGVISIRENGTWNSFSTYDLYFKIYQLGVDFSTELLAHMNVSPFVDETGKTITNNNVALDIINYKFAPGSALFNGTNAYLSTPGCSDLLWLTTDTVTIDFWLKLNATGIIHKIMGGTTWYSTESTSWTMDWLPGGQLRFQLNDVGPSAIIAQDTNWHHIVVVGEASTYKIYFDGNLVATGSIPWNIGSDSQPLIIGQGGYGWITSTSFLNGNVDELKISRYR